MGLIAGRLLGGLTDGPGADHMTRGIGAMLGAFLLFPVGAATGAILGHWLGGRIDKHHEHRFISDT